MTDRQNMERRRTYSCSGNLGIYVYLYGVEDKTPEEVASLFHQKADQVRHFALQVFNDAEEDAEISEMWDAETCEMLEEKDYYETE